MICGVSTVERSMKELKLKDSALLPAFPLFAKNMLGHRDTFDRAIQHAHEKFV
jgi:hypothetical protein